MRGVFVAVLAAWMWQVAWTRPARADPPLGAPAAHPGFHRPGHVPGRPLTHRFHGWAGELGHRSSTCWFVELPQVQWFTLSGYGLGGIPYYGHYGSGLFSLGDYSVAYWPGLYPWGVWVYDGPFLYGGPLVYPPVILPAETLFGPAAVRRFMGVEPPGLAAAFNRMPRAGEGPAGEPAQQPAAAGARELPPHAKETAQRLVGIGDRYFAQHRYAEALDRYRRAAQAVRGLAEPWFRQGFALVALGRYEAAAKAFRTGLRLDAGWPRSGFSLQGLYGDAAAMEEHLEALAQTARLQPEDADLLFLVGVFLYFSGQQDRSEVFFRRAEQLAQGDKAHLRAFLERQ